MERADLLAFVFDVLLLSCYFPIWYPGSGVVLDCIESRSLPPFLVCYLQTQMRLNVTKRMSSWYLLVLNPLKTRSPNTDDLAKSEDPDEISGSALFAKTKSIFRERKIIFFFKLY